MRIVGGAWSGRRLVAPKNVVTRPSSDRLKESLFNIIEHGLGHEMNQVVDFFAGSGALGFEALSRGATRCLFFEHDLKAIEAIKKNAETLALSEGAQWELVKDSRLERWSSLLVKSNLGQAFDTVFCDPPYRKNLAQKLLKSLAPRENLFAKGALWVAETAKEESLVAPSSWELCDLREVGEAKLHFFVKDPRVA